MVGLSRNRRQGGSIGAVDQLGRPLKVPKWYQPDGPTFSGGQLVIFKGATKRAKVGSKKYRKAMKKLTKATPFGPAMARAMEMACDRESLTRLATVAKDANASRPERMRALVQLDEAAFDCQGFPGKSVKVTKSAKKLAKQRREHLEHQALFAPDLQARIRAQDRLFGGLGNG